MKNKKVICPICDNEMQCIDKYLNTYTYTCDKCNTSIVIVLPNEYKN